MALRGQLADIVTDAPPCAAVEAAPTAVEGADELNPEQEAVVQDYLQMTPDEQLAAIMANAPPAAVEAADAGSEVAWHLMGSHFAYTLFSFSLPYRLMIDDQWLVDAWLIDG